MIGVDTEYRTKAQQKWLEVRALDRQMLDNIDRKKVKDPVLLQFVDRRRAQLDSWHQAPSKLLEEQLEIKERKATKPLPVLERKALEVEMAELEEWLIIKKERERVLYYKAPEDPDAFIKAVEPLNREQRARLTVSLFTKHTGKHPIEAIPPEIFVNRRVLFLDSWSEFYMIQGHPGGSFYMETGSMDDEKTAAYKSNSLPDLFNNGMDLMSIDRILIRGTNRPIFLKTDAKKAFPLVPVKVET